MKIYTSNRRLLQEVGKVVEMKNQGTIEYFANMTKYDEFLKNNQPRADSVMERVRAEEKKFFVYGENEQVLEEMDEAGKPTGRPKVQEGKSLLDISTFTAEVMDTMIEITLW